MDMGQPQPGGPPGADTPDPGQDMSQGYCLSIYVTPAGITVSKEPIDPQEEQGEQPGKPARDMQDAIQQVMQLYAQASGPQRSQVLQDAYKGAQSGGRQMPPGPPQGGM